MRKLINHLTHHAKKHGKTVHMHVRKHHQKYIFGAISGALVYKTLALILTTAAISPLGVTFASGAVDTGTVYTGTTYTGEVLSGDFFVNNGDSSTTGLNITINNNIDGATHMRFGNTESDRNIAAWDIYSNTQAWILDDNGTGTKTIYGQFSGNNSSGESIVLDLQDNIEYLPVIQNTGTNNTGTNNTGSNTTGETNNSGFVVDISPDIFDFTDVLNATVTTEYFSDTKLISGINTGIDIYISNGNYKINSDSRTSTSGVINSGDTVQVKLFSSDDNSTENILTLSVGDLDIDWSITTTGVVIQNTGTNNTGTNNTGSNTTGENNTGNSNQICDSQDITILNPLSGDIVKGEFNIIRDYNNTDCDNDSMTIKLRDANTQYINLGIVNHSGTTNLEFSFDSSMLYSGFYNIYSGVDLSGNNILIYTGQYTGLNTKYFSGHKLVVLNSSNEIMYEGNEFTIDNLKPELTNIVLSGDYNNNSYLGLDTVINLDFDSNEELSGVVVNILGVYAILESQIDNHYKYTIDLSTDNTEGNIIYNIEFEDIAGNTGYIEGNDNNLVFDKSAPLLSNISFTNSGSTIDINMDISENSTINFIYNLSGSNTGDMFENIYSNTHDFSLTGITSDLDYNYSLLLEDYAKNKTYIGGVFKISGDVVTYTSDVIASGDMIVDTGFSTGAHKTTTGNTNTGTVATGSTSSPANTFLSEINKFKMCKDSIMNISILEIPVRRYKARIEMPQLETNYVKKLVSAFSIVLFNRIENGGLSESEIKEITKEFNNFLVIIKLVRDDSNDCEQNLSNYYMSKFRDSLVEYNLVE